jgi:hypothetical protein
LTARTDAVAALSKERSDTVYQKTLGMGSTTSTSPPATPSGPGHIQLVGKSNAQAMRGEKPKLTMLSRNGR